MPHEPDKLLEDILIAISDLEMFSSNRSFDEFREDRQFQAAVERELEIIGEALYRLRNDALHLFSKVTDGDKIIGLRNILAHGYDMLDYEVLWDVVVNKLTILKKQTTELKSKIQ